MMKGIEALLSVRIPQPQVIPGTLNNSRASVLGSFDVDSGNGKPNNSIFRTIKFEFPKFDGTNPRSWIRKCNKLFSHHVVVEHQKLYLATMNLEGKTEEWYSGFIHEGAELTWEGFIEEITARFSPEAQTNPIGELKNLQQTGSVDGYRKKFEDLKSWSLLKNLVMNESFFMGGLREEHIRYSRVKNHYS